MQKIEQSHPWRSIEILTKDLIVFKLKLECDIHADWDVRPFIGRKKSLLGLLSSGRNQTWKL